MRNLKLRRIVLTRSDVNTHRSANFLRAMRRPAGFFYKGCLLSLTGQPKIDQHSRRTSSGSSDATWGTALRVPAYLYAAGLLRLRGNGARSGFAGKAGSQRAAAAGTDGCTCTWARRLLDGVTRYDIGLLIWTAALECIQQRSVNGLIRKPLQMPL